MNLIEFQHFTYAYSGSETVLKDIDLQIPAGSFMVLSGPNGSGKTTLCRAMGGIIPHYFGGSLAGEIYLQNKSVITLSLDQVADQVGLVFDDYESQLVTLSVAEEIAFALENQGANYDEIKAQTEKVLQQVGLSGLAEREVSSLSGGQKQRLVLASALAAQPEILVLDEPASALDPQGRRQLYQLLGQLNKAGLTIVVAEHDLAPLLPYADHLAVILAGQIAAQGALPEVLQQIQHEPGLALSLPPLWQLKLGLEQENKLTFQNWLEPEQAITELSDLLVTY